MGFHLSWTRFGPIWGARTARPKPTQTRHNGRRAGENHVYQCVRAILSCGKHQKWGVARGQGAFGIMTRSVQPETPLFIGSGLWGTNRTQMGPNRANKHQLRVKTHNIRHKGSPHFAQSGSHLWTGPPDPARAGLREFGYCFL